MTLKVRKFADFREPAIRTVVTDEEPISMVIMRLFASSADGRRVLAWMLAETGKVTPRNAPECALREAEGARRFIAEVHEITNGSHVAN